MNIRINKLTISTPIGWIALISALLMTFFVSDPASVFANSRSINNPVLPNQIIDPCDLIPPGGEISIQDDKSCTAQYGSNPSEKFVNTSANYNNTVQVCSALLEPNDYRVFMKEVNYGDCGIQVEIAYLGEPAPGYTGWQIHYYYQGIRVVVATKQEYPANQDWIYNTAREIELIIQNYLDISTSPETTDDLPDWIKNGQAIINERGNEIQVPEWLDWIKPKPGSETIQGVIEPTEGEIWIYSKDLGKWQGPAKTGDFIHSGDIIIAGDDSNAKIYVQGRGWLDTIHIADNASLRFPLPEKETDYPNLWILYSGMIKAKRTLSGEPLPPGMESPSPFTIGDYQGITGARSEFVFSYDPDTNISSIYLIEGEIDYYNLVAAGPDDGMLSAGQKLLIYGDGTERILPFEESELDSILAANNIKETEPLNQEEIEQLFFGISDGQYEGPSNNWTVILIVLGSILCFGTILVIGAVIVFFVIRSRKKSVSEK
jgi:hypothetical protein